MPTKKKAVGGRRRKGKGVVDTVKKIVDIIVSEYKRYQAGKEIAARQERLYPKKYGPGVRGVGRKKKAKK